VVPEEMEVMPLVIQDLTGDVTEQQVEIPEVLVDGQIIIIMLLIVKT